MKLRVKEKLDTNLTNIEAKVSIQNYHKFCYDFLHKRGYLLGIANDFQIVEDDEFYEKLQLYSTENSSSEFEFIDYDDLKRTFLSCIVDGINGDNQFLRLILSPSIEKNFINFDFLILFTIIIFKENQWLLNLYQKTYSYLIIDEFQDTTIEQYELIKLLMSRIEQNSTQPNILILLDPFQTIYKWLGADPSIYKDAINRFSCKKLFLKKDHRATNELKSYYEYLRTFIKPRKISHKFLYYRFKTKESEANYILNWIENEIKKQNGKNFQNLIAVLTSNTKLLNNLKRKLEKTRFKSLVLSNFSYSQLKEKYSFLFKRIRELIRKRKKFNFIKEIKEACIQNHVNFKNNSIIEHIITRYSEFSRRVKLKEDYLVLNEFLNNFLLNTSWSRIMKENFKNHIILSTIHGVKGLEFEKIWFLGLENGNLPFYKLCDFCKSKKIIDDFIDYVFEYYKFYVGSTRAKKEITYSYVNSYQGYIKNQSCFIARCSLFLEFLIEDDKNFQIGEFENEYCSNFNIIKEFLTKINLEKIFED